MDILLDRFRLDALHDPCCGRGTVVDTALARGIAASGADIADRAQGRFLVRDFLQDDAIYPNLVMNPPYDRDRAVAIILHAFEHIAPGGRVAVLVNADFRHSQERYPLFIRHCPELIIVLSQRPSCPPGEVLQLYGEQARGGGSINFDWIVWRRGYLGPCLHEWKLPELPLLSTVTQISPVRASTTSKQKVSLENCPALASAIFLAASIAYGQSWPRLFRCHLSSFARNCSDFNKTSAAAPVTVQCASCRPAYRGDRYFRS